MPDEEFEVPLDSDGLNWLRARYITVNGQVVRFSVQYETVLDGNQQPQVRQDNAHGIPHRDLLKGDGSQARHWFEGMSPGDAMTMGRQDLNLNWWRYRRQLWGDQVWPPDALTEEQVATIELRLDQAFAFFRNVLENPALLEVIPAGSILRFSDVMLGDVALRLTAYPDAGPNWAWTAKVTGPVDKFVMGREPADSSRLERGVPHSHILGMVTRRKMHLLSWKSSSAMRRIKSKLPFGQDVAMPDLWSGQACSRYEA